MKECEIGVSSELMEILQGACHLNKAFQGAGRIRWEGD